MSCLKKEYKISKAIILTISLQEIKNCLKDHFRPEER